MAVPAASTDPADLLAMLNEQFVDAVDSGRVSPERAQALKPVLDALTQLVRRPAHDTMERHADHLARLQELMQRVTPLLATAAFAGPAPPTGSRGAEVAQRLGVLTQRLAQEFSRPLLGAVERDVGFDLFLRLARARGGLADTDETRCAAFEHDVARPLAHEIDVFGRRHHLMLVRPFWQVPVGAPDPNAIFLGRAGIDGGPDALAGAIRALAERRRFRIVTPTTGTEVGQATWNAIWSSSVAVFDLRRRVGLALAGACYEIGLARALGRQLVIVADTGAPLPFDIEVEPLALAPGDDLEARLGAALDDAAYAPAPRESRSSVADAAAWLVAHASASAVASVRYAAQMVADASNDPIEVRRRIAVALGLLGDAAPVPVHPAWPGCFPAQGAPARLFHVMPYLPAWADTVRDAVASACADTGAIYVRGDEVDDARVIRSIWDEIGRASHVLIDLTESNANVALELGLAHGTGRRVMVVGHGNADNNLFPTICKLRLLPYAVEDGLERLRQRVRAFLASTPGRR